MTLYPSRRSATYRIGAALVIGSLSACAALESRDGPQAVAVIAPTSVASAASMSPRGTVKFVQQAGSVLVSGEISGLLPGREHGFHVHEAADCSGDGLATKGHFNPEGTPHGRHGSQVHHGGDLPSLKADAAGVARFSFTVSKLTVTPGPASVVARGLVVHRDPDDYTTQPTGNAGPRPGCGAIRGQ